MRYRLTVFSQRCSSLASSQCCRAMAIIAVAAISCGWAAISVDRVGGDESAGDPMPDRTTCPEPGDAGQAEDEETEIALPDWDLLSFSPSGDKELQRLDILLYPKKDAPFEMGVAGENGLKSVIDDHKTLWVMARSLNRPLRKSFPHRSDMWEGSASYVIGRVDVTRRDRKFSVWISQVGFLLESDSYAPQNVFYSWGLAKLIDDELYKQSNARLSVELFRSLSAEAYIDAEKRFYTELADGGDKQRQ